MAKELHVDATVITTAAAKFRGLPPVLDAAQNPLYEARPLKIGAFSEADALKTATDKSVGDFAILLEQLQLTFDDLGGALDTASSVLTDTEANNDDQADDPFIDLGGRYGGSRA